MFSPTNSVTQKTADTNHQTFSKLFRTLNGTLKKHKEEHRRHMNYQSADFFSLVLTNPVSCLCENLVPGKVRKKRPPHPQTDLGSAQKDFLGRPDPELERTSASGTVVKKKDKHVPDCKNKIYFEKNVLKGKIE